MMRSGSATGSCQRLLPVNHRELISLRNVSGRTRSAALLLGSSTSSSSSSKINKRNYISSTTSARLYPHNNQSVYSSPSSRARSSVSLKMAHSRLASSVRLRAFASGAATSIRSAAPGLNDQEDDLEAVEQDDEAMDAEEVDDGDTYGISGPKSVLKQWPFLVRKTLRRDLLSVTEPTFVFGARGSGARSAIRNAINRDLDFDFGLYEASNLQEIVECTIEELTHTVLLDDVASLEEHDRNAIAQSISSASSSGTYHEGVEASFSTSSGPEILGLVEDAFLSNLYSALTRTAQTRPGVPSGSGTAALEKSILMLAAKVAVGENANLRPIRKLRSFLGEQAWAEKTQKLQDALQPGQNVTPSAEQCFAILLKGLRYNTAKLASDPSAHKQLRKADAIEATAEFLAHLPDMLGEGSSADTNERHLASLEYFLVYLESELQQSTKSPHEVLSMSSAKRSDYGEDHDAQSNGTPEDARPSKRFVALGRCETLFRSEHVPRNFGQRVLGLFKAVFRDWPLLMHVGNGDGMVLLQNNPRHVIPVAPLREDMARALCEQVVGRQLKLSTKTSPIFAVGLQHLAAPQEKRKLPLSGADEFGAANAAINPLAQRVAAKKAAQEDVDENLLLEYWDWEKIYAFFGGHASHLKLFVQELNQCAKSPLNQELAEATDPEVQYKYRQELQTPKNLTHEVIRNARHTVLPRETVRFEWQVDYLKSSPLLESVSKMELIETIRAIIAQGSISMPENFNIENRILIALLDARLLIPQWEPARLQFPTKYTRHLLQIWMDMEYNEMSLKDRVEYNMSFWKHRDRICQSVKRVAH
ncbi:unnamed protein product [Amoebophrya sp. A25]|nr:unnamed protein product [Amoebophrya sp. A25]|eukprot:GSA25T00007657001.1